MTVSSERYPEPMVVPARTAPTSVVVASRLLAAMALLLLADMVAYAHAFTTARTTVHRVGPTVGATTDAMDRAVTDLQSGLILQLGVLFLFVGLLTMAAVFCRLGRRSGQIAGILATVPLLSCVVMPYVDSSGSALAEAVGAAQPGWVNALDLASRAVSVLGLIAIVLLLTGSARQWFSGLPPAPPGYMWVPAPLAGVDWSRWPSGPVDSQNRPPDRH